MKILISLAIASFWLLEFGNGQYFPLMKDGIRATVQHVKSNHELSERSAANPTDVFRKEMKFTVTLENGEIIELNLTRQYKQNSRVLVKVTSDSGSEMINMDKPKDYRFYQVLGNGGGAMVKCPKFTEPCFIAGNFYHQGNEYIIDPDTGVAANNPHTVYRKEPVRNKYGEDAELIRVVPPGPNEPENNSRKRRDVSTLLTLLRAKRQIEPVRSFKVELEMVVCDDVFTFWMGRLGQNRDATIQKIVEYYEQIANHMDIRYSSVTSQNVSIEIDIIPYLINIRETPSQCSWVTNNIVGVNNDGIEAYNAGAALNAFEAWGKSNKHPNSDAIMSFSRRDLWSGGVVSGNYTIGIARMLGDGTSTISATCRTDYLAASLVEDMAYGDASIIAAHELAHNLGVQHDPNTTHCLVNQKFIMSPSAGFVSNVADAKNPWSFSSCSINTLNSTLSKLWKDPYGLTCLERNSFDPAEYNRVLTSELLGEIYLKDEQCRLIIGPGSIYCSGSWTGVALADICWKGLPCSKSTSNGVCTSATFIHAEAGTSCGDSKLCYQGQCIASDDIPSADMEIVPSTTSSPTNSTTSSTTTTSTTTTTTTPTTTTTTPTTTTTTTTITTPTTTTTIPITTTITPTTTTTTPTTTTTTPTTTTTTPTTTTTTPTNTTTTPTTTTTTTTITTTTPTTTTTTPTTTTTTPTTTTTTPTTTTTTPTTTTTTPTTTTTTPTTTTTTPTTTTTTPTTTTPTTTTTTPTTTTTTPTTTITTTTTPTTTTTTPATTTTTPTTTTTTPTTTTTIPTTTTTTPTTTTTTPTITTTTPTTTTTTPTTTTTTPTTTTTTPTTTTTTPKTTTPTTSTTTPTTQTTPTITTTTPTTTTNSPTTTTTTPTTTTTTPTTTTTTPSTTTTTPTTMTITPTTTTTMPTTTITTTNNESPTTKSNNGKKPTGTTTKKPKKDKERKKNRT